MLDLLKQSNEIRNSEPPRPIRLFLIFFAFVSFFSAIGLSAFFRGSDFIEARENTRLETVSHIKAKEIHAWFDERWKSVLLLANNALFSELVEASAPTGKALPVTLSAQKSSQQISTWLDQLRESYGFLSAEVVDAAGTALLSRGKIPYSREEIRAWPGSGDASNPWIFIDLRPGMAQRPYMAFSAMIAHGQDKPGHWLIMTVDPEHQLFKILADKFSDDPAGQLTLFRVDATSATLLNRFQRDTIDSGFMQLPLASTVLAPKDGVYRGTDHRGIAVVSAIHSIEATPWLLATQMERQAMTGEITRLAIYCVIASLLGIAASAYLLFCTWRNQHERFLESMRLNDRLENAMHLAQNTTAAKSAFLANMSHEIRTPMNAIIGLTQMILRRESISTSVRESLEKVTDASNHLLAVINDILDLSRIESGRLVLEETAFSLEQAIVRRVINLISENAAAKGIELILNIDQSLEGNLLGDPTRLTQALLNLASNAVKFTDHGKIVIRAMPVAEESHRIFLRFEVSDSGLGIPPDQQSRLFNAFEQAENSTSRRYGGTGLGLAITQRLARLMGGEAGVISQGEGQGSTFWFTGWLKRGEKTPLPAEQNAPISARRVLIVDDLSEAREVLKRILESWGMSVVEADSGHAMIDQLRHAREIELPFDLLLVDLHMPDADGIEVFNEARTAGLCDHSQAILVTAYDDAGLEQRAIDHGFSHFLRKPVTPSQLQDALSRRSQRNDDSTHRPNPALAPRQVDENELGKGYRLLIAEDNPVNQEVIEQLLTSYGFAVELANNGAEAISMAKRSHYDLVFMDMQMPAVDGLEATKVIRTLPGWQTIPIIAMTANVFTEDREACLAAGMNEHLAKPVVPEMLFAVFEKWLALARINPAAPDNTEAPIAGTWRFLDMAQLAAATRNDRSAMTRLLQRVSEHHADDCLRLDNCLAEGNIDEAFRIAHSIKGMAGQIGANKLQIAAREAEASWRQGQTIPPTQLEELKETLDGLLREIDQWLSDASGSGELAVQTDHASFLDRTQQLLLLLNAVDGRAVSVAEQLHRDTPAACSPMLHEALHAVLILCRNFDLDGARQKLLTVISSLEESTS